MIYIVFSAIIVCIAGILYFSKQPTPGKKSRQQFLKELEDYFEAPLVPIEGYENSVRITFNFEKRQFIYEDIQSPGFRGTINRSYIQGRTNTNFTLTFGEKERGKFITGTEKKETKTKKPAIHLPKQLSHFSAYSNNTVLANKLLKDGAAVRIFSEFKNLDSRGRPLMTLQIVDGMVVLDFHPSGRCHPRPLAHVASLECLEDYLDKMIIVMDRLEALNK